MKSLLKKTVLIMTLVSLTGCGLFSKQIVYVPTPVPCPKVEIPTVPDYPVITRESSPRQVIEYFLLKTTLQEGYISQLTTILEGYQ